MGREFELKYTATAEAQAAIRDAYGPWQQFQMETTYFDTPDSALSAHRMTLRLRKENGETVCTLKTPMLDGSRGEWECPANDISSGIQALIAMGAPQILAELTIHGVIPCCGARFTRFAAQVATADGVAELALDRGSLIGGGREIPLCEVEIEGKTGTDAATAAFAYDLALQHALTEEPKSKFQQAMRLAQGE